MILGLSTPLFTQIHVILSLIGIGSGLIVLFGMIGGKLSSFWNPLFLVTTILTSLTGFAFPNAHVTPGIVIGVLSMLVLALALLALYAFHLAGAWRRTYAVTAAIALYFNTFVLIVQLFKHVPFLHALDPTQSGPPFRIAQLIVLAIFLSLTTLAAKRFRN